MSHDGYKVQSLRNASEMVKNKVEVAIVRDVLVLLAAIVYLVDLKA